MNDFVETEDSKFNSQLHDHCEGLDSYGATLGFSSGEIADAKKDSVLFAFLMTQLGTNKAFAQDFTNYKILARKGDGSTVLGAIPQPPAYPTPLPDVTAAGIEVRFRQRAAKAKASPNYTKNIGQALRIEKAHTPFDPNNGSPDFKIDLTHAGHPHISFPKGKWQGAEIWKLATKPGSMPQASDPAWAKLERVFGHDYIDPSELPAFGQATMWAYKLIYLYQNQQVGEWSGIKYVTLGGI